MLSMLSTLSMFAVVAVFVSACSDTDFSSSSPDGGEVDVGQLPRVNRGSDVTDDPADDATEQSSVETDATDDADATASAEPTSPSSAPSTAEVAVPISGVPGIDDGDPICESWSQLLGTRQVLTLAANFGELTADELARLEVIAAPLVRRATVAFGEALAAADEATLAGEREAVLDDLVGPLDRRAASAVAALADVGANDDVGVLLAQVWLDGLRSLGSDDVVPALADLGPELGPLVDDAVDVFADDAPAWVDDPTLDTSAVAAPATLGYLADRCPDLSSIGVGDAV